MKSFLKWFRQVTLRIIRWADWQQKLRTKIVWMVLLLGGLPLTVFAVIALQMGTAYVTMEMARHNQDKADQMSKIIDMYYYNRFEFLRRHMVEKAETLHPVFPISPAQFEKLLGNLADEFPDIVAVAAVDARGAIRYFKCRDHLSEFKTRFWHKIFEDKFYGDFSAVGWDIGKPRFFPEVQDAVVPLYVTLTNPRNQRVDYVVALYYSLLSLWDKQLGLRFSDQSVAELMDAEGKRLVQTSNPGLSVSSEEAATGGGAQSHAEAGALKSSWTWFESSPLRILQASARCPHLGWKINLQGDPALLLARIGKIRLLILGFWIGSFIFLITGGVWFVSRLIRPLENLETGIKLVSSGLMGDELPVFSHDEIGRLTQTFNQMTRTLLLRNEEIRGKTRELTFFNTITRIINQSVDLKTILDHSLQKILQLMHATTGLCYIYQPALKQFKLFSHFGVSEEFVNECSQLDLNQGLLVKIFSTGEPAMIRDVHHRTDAFEIIRHENIRDLLLVPLRSKKRTLGVLAVGSRRKSFFHYRDLDLLARIGDEIGMMVENAMLYAELQSKIKELEGANRELQELDRLKNRFLSNVSHELRTPITSIKTYIELFINDKIGPLTELQKEKILIVRRNVNNLMTLINDLLTLARLEDPHHQSLPLEVVSLTELAEQVIADTIEIARSKKLMVVRKGLLEPFPVRVHRQRIQQVLQNLISNAIKFTEKGTVTIALRRVSAVVADETGEQKTRDEVEISVSDTGIGIPAEALGKLFQRFYQVDASSTRKYVGTGLGLAIVKEILAGYHTEPKVESEAGKGSRFWFTLPLADVPKPAEY